MIKLNYKQTAQKRADKTRDVQYVVKDYKADTLTIVNMDEINQLFVGDKNYHILGSYFPKDITVPSYTDLAPLILLVSLGAGLAAWADPSWGLLTFLSLVCIFLAGQHWEKIFGGIG